MTAVTMTMLCVASSAAVACTYAVKARLEPMKDAERWHASTWPGRRLVYVLVAHHVTARVCMHMRSVAYM